ncbi:hypothetical protein LCGC14_2975040 [marine sediment metagenome]|uniref:Uncharacterized protein n=1 Tax=marine sediment metagenome TaxID=412755 RepID=A0A0F8VXW4_9ZZZZ
MYILLVTAIVFITAIILLNQYNSGNPRQQKNNLKYFSWILFITAAVLLVFYFMNSKEDVPIFSRTVHMPNGATYALPGGAYLKLS